MKKSSRDCLNWINISNVKMLKSQANGEESQDFTYRISVLMFLDTAVVCESLEVIVVVCSTDLQCFDHV